MIWRSDVFGGVQVDVSSFDHRFLEARLSQIRAGLEGRGKAELEDGTLTVQFGLSEAEQLDGSFLDDYRDALLDFLGLPSHTVLDQRIAPVNLPPEFDATIDRAVLALGLRAIRY